jgi:hypothetical protein
VDFEVPFSSKDFDPSKNSNTVFRTGYGLELNLEIGEPTLWSANKIKIVLAGLAVLSGFTLYHLIKMLHKGKLYFHHSHF